ncbi:PQQ-binding-like beta-propeller repeat protein [Streptomyces sp. NPDC059009]|uniref:outer membrane protein assembly factor BamB family protein n=1 Tax=Streptomyces sp. NPDC059009 TaxID=3346694 RepID=UPI0036C2FFD9
MTQPTPPPDGFGPPQGPHPLSEFSESRRRAAAPSAARRRAVLGAAATAAAVLVGGSGWFGWQAISDDGDADAKGKGPKGPAYVRPEERVPKDPTATFQVSAPGPELPKGSNSWETKGSWLTDKVYAKASVNRIGAVDAVTGKDKWQLPLPGKSCGASPDISKDGVSVVIAAQPTKKPEKPKDDKKDDKKDKGKKGKKGKGKKGDKKKDDKPSAQDLFPRCTEIVAFDVDTGKKLWTKSVTLGSQSRKMEFNQAAISGNTVGVGGIYGGVAFDLRSGKELWRPSLSSQCQDLGYTGGGSRLGAVRACGETGKERYKVQVLDPASGKDKITYKLPSGVRSPKIFSVDPLVVGVDSGEISGAGASDILAIDRRGKLRSKIVTPDRKFQFDCPTGIVNGCRGITVGNDKLYLATARHDGKGKFSSTNEIISYALGTGKTTGERADAGEPYEMFPIRMDGSNVLAYKWGSGVQIVSIDGRTMKQSTLLKSKASVAGAGIPQLDSEMRFTHGRFYISTDLLSRPTSKKGPKSYLALGFGTELPK